MIVEVIVPTDGTLEETLHRVSEALRKGKTLFRRALVKGIAVHGPEKEMMDGRLASLRYRLTDRARDGAVWARAPDRVVLAEYGEER